MEKKRGSGGPEKTPEIHVTIHHTDGGPSLQDCMIAILASHLPGKSL